MGQSSCTVYSAMASLVSSSFRAEAYTFSASRRTFSSTSLMDILGKSRGVSAESEKDGGPQSQRGVTQEVAVSGG